MRIIVVGAGKVGLELTRQLSVENQVTIIDEDAQLIDNVINIYDVMGVCGNGASYEMQLEAGGGRADLLIATTSSDEINILACLVAKKMGVQHTIARIRNPEYEKQLRFMREELGLSMSINPERAAAREKTLLYSSRAYRLISPPMELPAMKVWERPGRVRYSRSIRGLKVWTNQSMVTFPLPVTWPKSGS